MSEKDTTNEVAANAEPRADETNRDDKPVWVKPEMEDVSEQVMAQPYIRFT